ncbi:MAG: hypothetical protein ABJG68_00060 [Crocinitomicaceae bacterium]
MKRFSPICLLFFIIGFISCESEEYLPLETHEGKNTFGFISPDMVKRGGNIDVNDTIALNQGTNQFVFKLKTKSPGGFYKNGTWRFLNMYLTFNDNPSYHEYILDSAFYVERSQYTSDSSLFLDKSQDGVYFLDTTKNIHFWVFQHQEMIQQISGSFDFHMNQQRVYGDTTYIDTSNTIEIIAGRYDVIYSLE